MRRLIAFAGGNWGGDVAVLATHGFDPEWLDGARALGQAIEDVLTTTCESAFARTMLTRRVATTISIALFVGALVGPGATILVTRSGSSIGATLGAPPAFLPPCASPLYTADGNISPLFCKIDNPLALKFYRPVFPHLFALGRDASPQQVYSALKRDKQHATIPETCNAYALWQWRWHWRFGINPADEVFPSVPNACGA